MLEQCAVQIDEMQGAAERRVPEAADPKEGRRCRATQRIGYLHEQCSALHVKDHHIIIRGYDVYPLCFNNAASS